MSELVAITQPLEHWSAKPSELVSIGLQQLPMLRHLFAGVRIVSFLLSKSTSRPRPYK
jgi:hypothetical protein